MWQKSGMRLVKFTSPASDRGIAFLAINENNTFIYLPAYKKIRRIASHVRNQSFMGTDMSYEDMNIPRYGKEFDAEILKETEDFYILKLTRKPSSKVSYQRLDIHIHKKNHTMNRIDYYNDKGEVFKREVREKFHQYGETFWNAELVTVTDLKTGHKTMMEMSDNKFNSGVPDSIFTKRNLKRPAK
jgi:outer membrane lipoprotein-sorting protein